MIFFYKPYFPRKRFKTPTKHNRN